MLRVSEEAGLGGVFRGGQYVKDGYPSCQTGSHRSYLLESPWMVC